MDVKAEFEEMRLSAQERRRKEREHRESLKAWLEHHSRQADVHEALAEDHRKKYDEKSRQLRAMEWSTNGAKR